MSRCTDFRKKLLLYFYDECDDVMKSECQAHLKVSK